MKNKNKEIELRLKNLVETNARIDSISAEFKLLENIFNELQTVKKRSVFLKKYHESQGIDNAVDDDLRNLNDLDAILNNLQIILDEKNDLIQKMNCYKAYLSENI